MAAEFEQQSREVHFKPGTTDTVDRILIRGVLTDPDLPDKSRPHEFWLYSGQMAAFRSDDEGRKEDEAKWLKNEVDVLHYRWVTIELPAQAPPPVVFNQQEIEEGFGTTKIVVEETSFDKGVNPLEVKQAEEAAIAPPETAPVQKPFDIFGRKKTTEVVEETQPETQPDTTVAEPAIQEEKHPVVEDHGAKADSGNVKAK